MVDEEYMVHTHNGILFNQKNKKILSLETLLVLKMIMLNEINQPQKDNYCMIILISRSYMYILVRILLYGP